MDCYGQGMSGTIKGILCFIPYQDGVVCRLGRMEGLIMALQLPQLLWLVLGWAKRLACPLVSLMKSLALRYSPSFHLMFHCISISSSTVGVLSLKATEFLHDPPINPMLSALRKLLWECYGGPAGIFPSDRCVQLRRSEITVGAR